MATLEYHGASGSSDHARADSTESDFRFTRVVETLEIIPGTNGLSFGKQLRKAPVKGSFSKTFRIGCTSRIGFNGADVQTVVRQILEDAVHMCNIMLGLDDNDDSNMLVVSTEANLFTNRPDHCTVYFFLSSRRRRVPMVTVQDQPGDTAVDDNRVHGQKFDQLLKTVLWKHNGNAIGAITSIKKTRVAWIGDEANRIVEEGSFLSIDKLRECRNRLLPRDDGVPEEKSPSPRKKEDSSIQMQVLPATPHRAAKKPRIEEAKRELVLISSMCSAISSLLVSLFMIPIPCHSLFRTPTR